MHTLADNILLQSSLNADLASPQAAVTQLCM